MARKIIWTEPALEDLREAAEYISRSSEFYAATFVQRVFAAAESLSEITERGQVVPEFPDPSLREFLMHPYRLVYLVSESQVQILAIIHGAQRDRRYSASHPSARP